MRRFLKAVPIPFWCYFLPMVARTLGLLPDATFFYEALVRLLLPAALILLLLSAQLSSLFKMGKVALITMLAGSLGIILGGVVSVFVFRPILPEKAWMGLGTLAGSWIGGSLNMAALKEALGTPSELFSPMIFVDSVIAYSWMGFLLFLAPYQIKFDQWNDSKKEYLDTMGQALQKISLQKKAAPITFKNVLPVLGIASLGTFLSLWLSQRLPVWKGGITPQTWLVLVATTLAILFSLTPLSRLEAKGASRFGELFLYLMLLAMGAQADLHDLARFPIFVCVGVVWVLIHGAILFCFGRIFKIPLFFLATASQANVGGVVSAPIVAACYQKPLAPLGLLLAIFGNITGTYLGLLTAHLMRLIS